MYFVDNKCIYIYIYDWCYWVYNSFILFAGALNQVCIEKIVLYIVGTCAVVVVLSACVVIISCAIAFSRRKKDSAKTVKKTLTRKFTACGCFKVEEVRKEETHALESDCQEALPAGKCYI